MSNENDMRRGRHDAFLMHVHLVFVTQYRREVFTREILDDRSGICADFEAELVAFDGEDDHVHLLVNYPPKVAVSALVNSLKGVSSRMIRKKNDSSIRKKRWRGGRRPASPEAAAALPSKSSASTSSSSRHHTDRRKDAYGVRAILPRPEGRSLPRTEPTFP
tara:strand:+ start:8953 stop:9438 length:486 start_codon:yes stop_codon:yes gene_type:complete